MTRVSEAAIEAGVAAECANCGSRESLADIQAGKAFLSCCPERDMRTGERKMTFGAALEALKSGDKVARAGWNGKGVALALQTPDAHSKMSLPYIYMRTVTGDLVPWLASQSDMLAEDWEYVA